MDIKQLSAEWIEARNNADESQIYACDGMYAARMGLPTLAALCDLLRHVNKGGNSTLMRRPEVEAVLRMVLQVAVGEANERARILLCDPSVNPVPGVPVIPTVLLERDGGGK